ncbi:hypothetical protein [Bradyrhizobium algeriense]|uniref:hypothetical protein n=1 Tax=Bradyrhizobium algeriense TaxID=634784 RepID=UPI00167EBE5A|nr:hypothetical protein [Bradyrhizobium algeriense]
MSAGPSPGGIAARPKFSGEVEPNIDNGHPSLVELGIEMFEPGLHLAGFDRRDLLLAQILGANGPPIAGGHLVLVGGWSAVFGHWGSPLLVGFGHDAPLLSVADNRSAPAAAELRHFCAETH